MSCSVLHSCQPEVKVWTSAQNTRKPSSPRNVSCLLGDPSYVVISLQAVLERLENLLFIINTLYWGLGRDKPLLESTGTDLHTNGFHGEAAADWGAWILQLQKYFFSTQSENPLTRQKSQLSTQRSSERTGAFISAGVWSWIPEAATFAANVDSHGFQHLWRGL